MTNIRLKAALFGMVIGMGAIAPSVKADQWDHKVILTTSTPLNVSGTVLEPGKYVLQLLYVAPSEHVVQIMNMRENHLITTVIAHPVGYMEQGVPARLQGPGAGKSHFTFWETQAGEPKALRDWYYPGSFQGQEFPYRKTVTQVTQVTRQETTPAPVAEAAPAPEPPAEIAQNTPPPAPAEAPAPAPEAAPAPEPQPATVAENVTPRTIPQTAGNIPLLLLAGFGSIALAFGVGVFAKRMN